MSKWWQDDTWKGWDWQRRAQEDLQPPGAPSAYPPTGPAGRPRKREGSSRGAKRGDPRPRVAPDARASTVMPPRPPRLPPIVLPTYPTVAAFDDPRAPWPRESPTGGRSDFEPTAQLSEYCQKRWFLYCRKFTPLSVVGWRPSFSGKNAFLCHESRTVFPALYQARGHARADDEQALRQAGRAARREASSAGTTVPGTTSDSALSVDPRDAYLGDSRKFLRETDNPDFPCVVNDEGVYQPMMLGTPQAKIWFLKSTFNGSPGDLIKASKDRDQEGKPYLKLFNKHSDIQTDFDSAARAAAAAGLPGQPRWQEAVDEVFKDSPTRMFPDAPHTITPPVAHPVSPDRPVPLCTLRDVQFRGEHMGSDWCRKRSGRICIKYPSQCCYGRLCNKIHTQSYRVICTKVRYMLAGVKDREGNLITCDGNCPWVPIWRPLACLWRT